MHGCAVCHWIASSRVIEIVEELGEAERVLLSLCVVGWFQTPTGEQAQMHWVHFGNLGAGAPVWIASVLVADAVFVSSVHRAEIHGNAGGRQFMPFERFNTLGTLPQTRSPGRDSLRQ